MPAGAIRPSSSAMPGMPPSLRMSSAAKTMSPTSYWILSMALGFRSGPDIGRRLESFDRLVEHQVLVDDGGNVFGFDAGVHDAFRVDQHAWAEVAGAKAAGVGELEAGRPQVAGSEFIREGLPDLAAAFFLAGSARMALWATLNADEDVFFRFGHDVLLLACSCLARGVPTGDCHCF